jgi:protein transport protein DSL1/ZW10
VVPSIIAIAPKVVGSLTGYQEVSDADIAYLFDQAALVNFEVDELLKLVKGLFEDTPLHASTISKISSRHPV